MKARATEEQPAIVPTRAKQVGDVRVRWAWSEPSVWTDRMLTALESGVKGGKWFSLIDKVYAAANLRSAFDEVKANHGAAGVDHQTIEMFATDLDKNLRHLAETLESGTYVPSSIRRTYIPKPGTNERRPLGIPTVRDRVVQAAMRHVLEPIFERDFAAHSYGFRPGRGCKDALRRVDTLLTAGSTWVVDADLKSYFDTIPHGRLMECIEAKVSDGRVLALIESFLQADVLDTATTWTPDKGCPQGAVLSPLLSNIYLNDLDHTMALGGWAMTRYADDFVILCRSEQEARAALSRVEQWTAPRGLTLHATKTRLVNAAERGGFDFLGYHFERGYRWPRVKSLKKLRTTIRGKTRRTNGHSLNTIIGSINGALRGWFNYFQHSHTNTFPSVDGWVRMRLRSILRKRSGRRGRGRGQDHHRWPNAFFAAHGLFSLTAAYVTVRQSPPG